MDANSVIIIQARTASSRLPGKVLLPLGGKTVIEQIIDRSKKSKLVDSIIVATTFHTRDDLIEEYALSAGVQVYRGSEDDVLGRVCRAAEKGEADVVARLTGDNPFVIPELIDAVIEPVRDGIAEYASNKIRRTLPLGIDAEAIAIKSLKSLEKNVRDKYHREHALRYIRKHHDRYNIANISKQDLFGESCDIKYGPELRLTLDEPKDYIMYKKIFEGMKTSNTLCLQKVIEFIEHEELFGINKSVKQKTY